MISCYRTFTAVAQMLGVRPPDVVELVDDGPLIARVFPDGRRLIHHDDLVAFRRPLGVVMGYKSLPDGSDMLQAAKAAIAGVGLTAPVDAIADYRTLGRSRERWAPVRGSDRHEVSTHGRLRTWRLNAQQLAVSVEVAPSDLPELDVAAAVLEAFGPEAPEAPDPQIARAGRHLRLVPA